MDIEPESKKFMSTSIKESKEFPFSGKTSEYQKSSGNPGNLIHTGVISVAPL
jgi:hypothetical protein